MASPPEVDRIAYWGLAPPCDSVQPPTPDNVAPRFHSPFFVSSPVDDGEPYTRMPVSEANAKPGGKYYPIVKLFIRWEHVGHWTTATGWLLREDVVVTAARCINERDYHAESVVAIVGYQRDMKFMGYQKPPRAGPETQMRCATRVVAPAEWTDMHSAAEAERHDFAFLQLDEPFRGVEPLGWSSLAESWDVQPVDVWGSSAQSPSGGHLTVVGYPTDVDERGMPGGAMYEKDVFVESPPEDADGTMSRKADLEGGFSGAPVIRKSNNAAVGVYVHRGSGNSVAVISWPDDAALGRFAEVMALLAAPTGNIRDIGGVMEIDRIRKWLRYVCVPRNRWAA